MHGQVCQVCQKQTNQIDMAFCEQCERDMCDDCTSAQGSGCCVACEQARCVGCGIIRSVPAARLCAECSAPLCRDCHLRNGARCFGCVDADDEPPDHLKFVPRGYDDTPPETYE